MRIAICGLLAGLLLTSGGREAPSSGPPSGPVTLALAGDLSLARGVAQANATDWPATLRAVAPPLRADLVAANLIEPIGWDAHRAGAFPRPWRAWGRRARGAAAAAAAAGGGGPG